jgi:hypothetical protein
MLGPELYDKYPSGAIPKPGKDAIVSKNCHDMVEGCDCHDMVETPHASPSQFFQGLETLKI